MGAVHVADGTPKRRSPAGPERLPLQTAVGGLEGAVDVVIAGVAGAGVRLGQGHLVVDVGVDAAQAAAAGGTGPPRLFLAEPALHGRHLTSEDGGPQSIGL